MITDTTRRNDLLRKHLVATGSDGYGAIPRRGLLFISGFGWSRNKL